MRNALELLRQKETDLAKLRKEAEALRIVALLLRDDKESLIDIRARDEQADLQCTGTDGFVASASRVFAASEWEVNCGQPFLVPKPTSPESGFWLRLSERKRMILADLRRPTRRWRYVGVGVLLVFVAISGFAFGSWIGHLVSASRPTAHTTEAFR